MSSVVIDLRAVIRAMERHELSTTNYERTKHEYELAVRHLVIKLKDNWNRFELIELRKAVDLAIEEMTS